MYKITVEIDPETGDTVLPLTPEILKEFDWKVGDTLEGVFNADGTMTLNSPSRKTTYDQIAFGNASHPGKVSIWCDRLRYDRDGTLHFSVINGGWDGRFRDGQMWVENDIEPVSNNVEILWRGSLSRYRGRPLDYNEAIPMIEKIIADPDFVQESLTLEAFVPYEDDEIPF